MEGKETARIVILGAGPAGCSCAISLVNAGYKEVYILDNSKGGKFHIGESIPPDMNLLLKQLGVYESFLNQEHEACYGSCSYWGSPMRGYNDSMLSPYGHGWHLDRSKFNKFLIQESEKRGVRVLQGITYLKSNPLDYGYRLDYQDIQGNKNTIKANFVVDATGGRGVFAQEHGSLKIHGTPLVCIGIRFKNKGRMPVSKLTHLESVQDGWWYAARIPGEYLLVTFYTTSERVKALGLHDLKNWFNLLAESPNTWNLVAKMEPAESKIRGFKASSFCLNKVSGKDWLAIGDAATAYDPITSQGIIKATTHGVRAAEIIGHHLAGTVGALEQFQSEIQAQYANYISSRSYFYNLEKRWPNSSFWKTMQAQDELAAVV